MDSHSPYASLLTSNPLGSRTFLTLSYLPWTRKIGLYRHFFTNYYKGMQPVLIVYGTHEGHTRKIAYRIEQVLNTLSVPVEVLDSAEVSTDFDASNYAGFIIAGSIHQGNHQRALAHFVKAHRDDLTRHPSLFLSVSLTAVHKDGEHQVEVKEYIDRFLTETAWMPHQV